MREIIFRGKRKDTGEWVYGNLVKTGIKTGDFSFTSEGGVGICDSAVPRIYGEGFFSLKINEVIPETVGQYTGVCDKNGNKIFEGDIVRCENTRGQGLEGYVLFVQSLNRYIIRVNDYRVNVVLSNEVTVVGNVHGDSGLETLKPCPFCGKSDTVWVGTDNQINENEPDSDNDFFAVNCSLSKGGCGATSGYMETKKEAIKKWNVRVKNC